MNAITDGYELVSRADLSLAHVTHHRGMRLLCVGALADWIKIDPGIKPMCKQCVAELEDREYRAKWNRKKEN